MTEHVHRDEWCAKCVEHGVVEEVRRNLDTPAPLEDQKDAEKGWYEARLRGEMLDGVWPGWREGKPQPSPAPLDEDVDGVDCDWDERGKCRCRAATPAPLDVDRLIAHLRQQVRNDSESAAWRHGVEYAIECIESAATGG
jgi:hypothetical protein